MDNSLIGFSATVLTGFFAIMNPIANTPIFMGLVEGLDENESNAVARRAVLTAILVVATFTIGGSLLFKLFGITLHAFKIAGGIIVFSVGLSLLNGRTSTMHHPEKKEGAQSSQDDIAIIPLAIPILGGPGTISTAMSFSGGHETFLHTGIVLAGFLVISAATYFMFIYGKKIMNVFNPKVISVITRLMGLILTVIAVQMIVEGVQSIAAPMLK